jgi:3-oxoacyl-[acyl-carrier-protein] synthase III
VIAGTGSYTPARILHNLELAKMVETSDEWIRDRTGISERRIAAPDEAASDLALFAAQKALADASLTAADIDLIIVATMTPDHTAPSTACFVQQRLGIQNAAAFDVAAACSGFVYALETGAALIRCGTAKRALIIGAEKLSSVVDWKDRTTCVLFGDGAGAVVLEAGTTHGSGLLRSVLHAQGSLADLLIIPAGGSRQPTTAETLAAGGGFLKMRGREVFKHAVRNVEEVVTELLSREGLKAEDVDLFVPHQANMRIIESLAGYLKVPMDRFVVNLERYGNTSAASVPLALDEAARSGRLKRGHLCVMVGFGAGFTWGASLVRW